MKRKQQPKIKIIQVRISKADYDVIMNSKPPEKSISDYIREKLCLQ